MCHSGKGYKVTVIAIIYKWRKLSIENIEHKQSNVCFGPAAVSWLEDQRPPTVLPSFDFWNQNFPPWNSAAKNYSPKRHRGLLHVIDIHLLYSLRKNSRRPLWSLCRNWRRVRRNYDTQSDTSRWVHFLSRSFKMCLCQKCSSSESRGPKEETFIFHSTPRRLHRRRVRGFSPSWSDPLRNRTARWRSWSESRAKQPSVRLRRSWRRYRRRWPSSRGPALSWRSSLTLKTTSTFFRCETEVWTKNVGKIDFCF